MVKAFNISFKTKFILIGLLVVLNLVLRIPAVLHEIGWDSFAIHLMANSLSEFGHAKWWVNPASIFGSYPYSTSPSTVPFLISSISQLINLDTEVSIFIYSMILGIFSIFASYLMAGSIWKNDFFKIIVAFIFPTLQGILSFSTWTANARTLLIILLPLFIYVLLKSCTYKRFIPLTLIFFLLFFTTHHMFYFTIPIIFALIIIVILYKSKKYIHISENHVKILAVTGFIIMFSFPFFTRTLMDMDPGGGAGGRYTIMFNMIFTYLRYIGILAIIGFGGFVFLLLKENKTFQEWFLLLSSMCLTPLLYIQTYMKWFILSFVSLFIGIGLINIVKSITNKKKYHIFIVVLLLISIVYTGYYQFLHFLNDPDPNERYLEEQNYQSGIWIKQNINQNMVGSLSNVNRIAAVSKVPTLTGIGANDLAYGLADLNKVNISQKYSLLSYEFYFKDPYVVTNNIDDNYFIKWLLMTDVRNPRSDASKIISMFNLKYYAENNDETNYKLLIFSESVHEIKNNLFDNGKIKVWSLY